MTVDTESKLLTMEKLMITVNAALGTLLLGVVFWMASAVQTATVQIAELSKELELTKPADVLKEVVKTRTELGLMREQINRLSNKLAVLEESK